MFLRPIGQVLFGIGLLIVIFTHIYILLKGMPSKDVNTHAIVNLVAAALIGGGAALAYK